MSSMYFFCSVPGVLRLADRNGDVALVGHGNAERRDPFAEPGDAKRRRPHVDTSPAAAEIERNADEMDGYHGDP